MANRTPTKQELLDAAGKTLPDVIAYGLRVLFCGINPGLYSAAESCFRIDAKVRRSLEADILQQ